MKAGFLKPDNSVDYMEYYEIGKYCKDLCLSKANKSLFTDYIVKYNYSYFNAYFDYVLHELGYILINPLLEPQRKWVASHGSCNISTNASLEYDPVKKDGLAKLFVRATDEAFAVNKQVLPLDAYMDLDGYAIQVLKDEYGEDSNCWGHYGIGCLIVNNLLIQEKDVYQLYEQFIKNNTTMKIHEFLIGHLGFLECAMRHNTILYNNAEGFFSIHQMEVIEHIKKYYNCIIESLQPEEHNKQKCYSAVNRMWSNNYENR